MSDFIGTILVGLLVTAVVFLILREVLCWYWKINQKIELLTEIRNLLRNQADRSINNKTNQVQQTKNPNMHTFKCEICKNEFPISTMELYNGKTICPDCKTTYSDRYTPMTPR